LYVGGTFTTAGGAGANRIASWDGSSWSPLGTGLNNHVYAIVFDSRNIAYVGGVFTTAGGATANRIATWNGTAWSTLGVGMDAGVWELRFGADEMLYAGGAFTTAGGVSLADRIARWNGAVWAHMDIDFPGAPNVRTIICSASDPVIPTNYDIWVGWDTAGTGYYAGIVTLNNPGTQSVYPRIIIERSGGTTATLETMRNETTGKLLLFDYDILDGERITIDLRPTQKSFVSSMFGSRPDAIFANSDIGDFVLEPGDNDITSFVHVAGAPTITAWMEWQIPYSGL